jgi:outer membrane protein assembly factor BamB
MGSTLLGTLLLAVALEAAPDGQDWPQWRGARRDGVWRETGIVERFDGGRIPVRWSVPVGGGYNGPTVASGRVFVMDRPKDRAVERVLCLDWKTGRTVWEISYDALYEGFSYTAGPRASVTVADGRAYALGAAGHLHCAEAATGRILWKRDLRREYRIRMPLWGIAASPIVEGDLLITQIAGEGEACVVALDRKTGEERWRAFPDEASYAPPIAFDQAGRRVVVLPLGFRLVAFGPADGKLLWSFEIPKSAWPISIPSPVVSDDLLFWTSGASGSVLFRLAPDRPAVDVVWRHDGRRPRTPDTLTSVIPTPVVLNGLVVGVQGDGELRCLDLMTGKRHWETTEVQPKSWHGTMHLVRAGEAGDRAWIFSELGELILARLTAERYQEISRAKLIAPTVEQGPRGRAVTWSHPAFAYRHVFARSDRELVAADLSAPR